TSSKAGATEKFPQVGIVSQWAKSNDAAADAWVGCFSDAGKLIWSSFKGGGGEDLGLHLSVRTINGQRVLVGTGSTTSSHFPTQSSGATFCGDVNPLQKTYRGGAHDAYIVRWIETPALDGAIEAWSTY